DSYNDSPAITYETAKWLKDSLKQENRIHLWGNHDLHYGYWWFNYTRCSGYEDAKRKEIWRILKREDFNKLKWYHREGDIVFTHAGIDRRLFYGMVENIDNLEVDEVCMQLDKLQETVILSLEIGKRHPF